MASFVRHSGVLVFHANFIYRLLECSSEISHMVSDIEFDIQVLVHNLLSHFELSSSAVEEFDLLLMIMCVLIDCIDLVVLQIILQ